MINPRWQFCGCGTALLTPFNQEGKIDQTSYVNLVARQIEQGVDFLVPLGSTAETATLTASERERLLALTVETNQNRVPLLVGVGSNNLAATLENMERYLSLAGNYLQGFLVVTPFYNKPTPQGLLAYFTEVANASPLPIVLYNVPGRTGVNLPAAVTLQLAQHPRIVGVKEASGNLAQISEIIARAPADFAVLSGDDEMTLATMAHGGAGVISVASNLAPRLMQQLVAALFEENLPAARKLHNLLRPLFKACFTETNPIPAKMGLALLNLALPIMRLPLVEANKQTQETMAQALAGLADYLA